MIVIAIFGLMMGMLVFGLRSTQLAETTRAVNQVATAVRYGYDKARVNGSHYRLHIDLEKGAFSLQEANGAMYLPATDRDGKILEIDESELEAQEDRDRQAEESYNASIQSQILSQGVSVEEESPEAALASTEFDPYKPAPRKVPRRKPPMFSAFEDGNALSGLAKPIELPDGVKITYVRTADDLEPITSGEASIYFFPRGRTQQAHILLEDQDKNEWTIKVAPLTGRVTIEDGHEELELPEEINDVEDDLGNKAERRTL